MTTTTGEPSTLKSPASLSSGDLVSRLLAATPPYLYNVPLTPHSFFFSEMLRSFVQAKTEASSVANGGNSGAPNAPRRRKRSWRDARDRPLELTMKERPHHHQHHHHHHHHHHQHPDKYYHSAAQQQQQQPPPPPPPLPPPPQIAAETRLENDAKRADAYHADEQKPDFGGDILKPADDGKVEFPRAHGKSFFDERPPRHLEQAQPPENGAVFVAGGDAARKIKPEDSQQDRARSCSFDATGGRGAAGYAEERAKAGQEAPPPPVAALQLQADQKKLELARGPYLPGLPARGCDVLQGVKGFSLPGGVSGPAEFLPGPLWYPPYPMPQSYPGIDPLHFFIDLRVSGHIWDRKHASERQLPFKSKHCSAFSVPQSKEYGNRPLNLTRDEATTSKDAENARGTNYILKHLTRTYQDIRQTKATRTDGSSTENDDNSKEAHQAGEDTARVEDGSAVTSPDDERKDLRALIGLELVVDYVKEPKTDPPADRTSPVTE